MAAEPRQLTDRLKQLDTVENEICDVVEAAYNYVSELSKEKLPTKTVMDRHLATIKEKLKHVDQALNDQIDYLSNVSVGAAHEGSSFLAVQEKNAADSSLNYANERLSTFQTATDTST